MRALVPESSIGIIFGKKLHKQASSAYVRRTIESRRTEIRLSSSRDFKGHIRNPTTALENTGHCLLNQIALNGRKLVRSSTAPKLIMRSMFFSICPSGELKVLPGNLIQPLAIEPCTSSAC